MLVLVVIPRTRDHALTEFHKSRGLLDGLQLLTSGWSRLECSEERIGKAANLQVMSHRNAPTGIGPGRACSPRNIGSGSTTQCPFTPVVRVLCKFEGEEATTRPDEPEWDDLTPRSGSFDIIISASALIWEIRSAANNTKPPAPPVTCV